MRQQINLFQSVLIDKSEPLQARQLGLILLGFMGLLLLLSLLGYWQFQSAGDQLTTLQQQKTALTAQVEAWEKQYPERQKSVLLEEEIERSKRMLAGQKRLLGYFSQRDEEGNEGALGILEGLARYRSSGVWLSRIQLDLGDDSISLGGSALRPEQVPQYLQALGERGVLAGRVFSRLKLTQLQERPGQVDFRLETSAEGQR